MKNITDVNSTKCIYRFTQGFSTVMSYFDTFLNENIIFTLSFQDKFLFLNEAWGRWLSREYFHILTQLKKRNRNRTGRKIVTL